MIDLGPPPLIFPTPVIIQTVDGGLWGSLDRELTRLGLRREIRRAVLTELRRVVGSQEARPALADLSCWTGVKLAMLPGLTP